MASCAHPALSQHPTHNNPPPPPPRPPAHRPPPTRQPPRHQTVKPQQQPSAQAEKPVTPQQQVSPQSPAVGTRVPEVGGAGGGGSTVPHPPVRPWEQRNADIPASERPPPGMCRVWLDHVPAASQPAPTTCSKAIQMHPPNGHVVFGEDGGRPTATRVPPAAPSESSPPDH